MNCAIEDITYRQCCSSNLKTSGVIPAQAGIQENNRNLFDGIPACAGMTLAAGISLVGCLSSSCLFVHGADHAGYAYAAASSGEEVKR